MKNNTAGRTKKAFRKALSKKLGVNYSEVKNLFPSSLNSTSIANYLNPHITRLSHEEIRNACQDLKLELNDYT